MLNDFTVFVAVVDGGVFLLLPPFIIVIMVLNVLPLISITFVICHSLPPIMCMCAYTRLFTYIHRVSLYINVCVCVVFGCFWGCERGLIPILQRFNTLQRVNQSHNANVCEYTRRHRIESQIVKHKHEYKHNISSSIIY